MNKNIKHKLSTNKKKNTLFGFDKFTMKRGKDTCVFEEVHSMLIFNPPLNLQPKLINFDFSVDINTEYLKHEKSFIKLLDKEVLLFDGKLLLAHPTEINEAGKYYTQVLILLNIIGIPMNLLKSSYIVVFLDCPRYLFRQALTNQVGRTLLHLPKINIEKEETNQIIEVLNSFYS